MYSSPRFPSFLYRSRVKDDDAILAELLKFCTHELKFC
jgi:hypothetical protein